MFSNEYSVVIQPNVRIIQYINNKHTNTSDPICHIQLKE